MLEAQELSQYFIFIAISFDVKLNCHSQLRPECVMANGHNGAQVLLSVDDPVVFVHDSLCVMRRIVRVHG